jgi:hypothetical protein
MIIYIGEKTTKVILLLLSIKIREKYKNKRDLSGKDYNKFSGQCNLKSI